MMLSYGYVWLLELDMERLTGSKLGKEYNKAIYCHPAYFTYMQSTEAYLIAQLVKNPPAIQETPEFDSWVRKIHWRRDRLPIPVFLGFLCDSAGKESTCNVGDLGLIPGLERSPGEGNGYPLQYSGLENYMDCIFHVVAKSQT